MISKNLNLIVFCAITFSIVIIASLIDKYSYNLVIIILFVIICVIAFLFFIEFNFKLIKVISILILSFGIYAYSGFPGRNFFAQYNYFIFSYLLLFLSLIHSYFPNVENIRFCSNKFEYSLLLLLLFALIISIFYNYSDLLKLNGIPKILNYLFSAIFFSFIFPKFLLLNETKLYLFLKILVYFGIFCAVIGIISMFIEINPYSQDGLAVSIFTHPNATASIYNFTIPPTLYFLFFRRNLLSLIEKTLMLSGLVVSVFALLFTYNRTGIISLGIIFLIMAYYYSKKLLLIIVPILAYAFNFIMTHFITIKGATTVISRFGLLSVAIEMLRSSTMSLLWGYGTISTITIFEQVKIYFGVFDVNNNPHNIFIFYVLQFGLISAIPLFVYLFIIIIKSSVKFFKKNPNKIFLTSFSICLSLLFKNLFEDELILPQYFQYNLFLIFLGIMIYLSNKKNSVLFQRLGY